ncbi:ATP-dependent endonuclease, partial [Enterocloster bolteae]|nr:ATP-dependent endonuclease [Enterocloster bolteae]
KNIKSLLKEVSLGGDGRNKIKLQTIITTHSSHIVSECEFDDIKYFQKISGTSVISKNLKNLEADYKDESDPENKRFKFLKQYLTLSYAEIFFADKVILYEGDTERI